MEFVAHLKIFGYNVFRMRGGIQDAKYQVKYGFAKRLQ